MSYMQQRRASAAARGLCGTCCKREPSGDKKTCDVCIAQTNASRERREAVGDWCLSCIAFGFHREECR